MRDSIVPPRAIPVAKIAAIAGLGTMLLLQYAPALTLFFAGDDFELLSLARIGGLHGALIPSPHRGMFVKPIMSLAWVLLASLFGADPPPWFAACVATHLLNAALLGLLAKRLAEEWGSARGSAATRIVVPGGVASCSVVAGGVVAGSAGWIGIGTAAAWSLHDRLSEPVFSVSAWNHSLTLAFSLVALLLLVHALSRRSRTAALLFGLSTLLALLTYEVSLSLPVAALLMILLHPSGEGRTLGARLAFIGPSIGGAVLAYVALRLVLGTQAPRYYGFVSPAALPSNVSEITLSCFHIPPGWMAPGPFPAIAVAALLAASLTLTRDAITRFALGWFAAACLVVALLPDLSDRHHYIPFAALALAAGRLLAVPRLPRLAVSGVLLIHLAWSFGGSREQARWYALKGRVHAQLVEEASESLDATPAGTLPALNNLAGTYGPLTATAGTDPAGGSPGPVFAILWEEGAESSAAGRLAAAAARLPSRFGAPTHPVYVRPRAVAQLVYAPDLYNVARARRGEFYRTPEAARAARAIADGSLRLVRLDPLAGRTLAPPPGTLQELRERLVAGREVPVVLPSEPGADRPAMRIAYLERTDRAGAFASEYGGDDQEGPR